MWWLVILILTGGPWAMLQVIAWCKMVIDYSQTGGVGEAVVKTFNGANPCRMCKSIAQARATEQRKDPARTATVQFEQFWMAILPVTDLTMPRPHRWHTLPNDFPAIVLTYPPLTPPPRLAALG